MKHTFLIAALLSVSTVSWAGTPVTQADQAASASAAAHELQSLRVDERPDGRLRIAVALDGRPEVIDLAPYDVRTPDFRAFVEDADGLFPLGAGPAATYRGSLHGDPETLVAGSYRKGRLTAMIFAKDRARAWSIEPADGPSLYSVREAAPDFATSFCGVRTTARPIDEPPTGAPEGTSTKEHAEIALDCDVEFFTAMGSDAQAAADYMVDTLAVSSLVFENDLDVVLRVPVVLVRTDPNAPNYPYTGQEANLFEVQDWWENETSISFDTVHLFSGRSMGLGIAGRAWISGLCRETPWRKSGMSRSPQTDLPSMIYVVTHELGHNFGSNHTQGGVMEAAGITGNLFFDSQSQTWINNWLNQITCLTPGSDGSYVPVVSSVSPSSLDLAEDPVTFSVLGQNMASVIQIDIGGESLYYGDFEHVSNGELVVRYSPSVLGAHPMTLRSPVGSDQATVTFVEPTTPVLREPVVYELIGNRYSRWTTVAGPDDTVQVVYNLDGQTSLVGGWPVLTNRITIGTETCGINGVSGVVEWAPDPTLFDLTLYVQSIVFDAQTGAFSTTNVQTVCHGPIGPCQ